MPSLLRRFLIILGIIGLGIIGAARPSPAQVKRRSVAQAISRWTATIDASLSRMRRTAVDLPGTSTEGSQLILYGRSDSLEKLVAIYMGETGKATECYYVRADTLRYFSRRELHYDRPLSGHVVGSTVERLWFAGDSTIQWADTLGRILHVGKPLAARGAEVRREFRNAFRLSHEGYPSRDRMSNERCN